MRGSPKEPEKKSPSASRTEVVVLLAILALALVLRLVGIGSRDFWQDEILTLLKTEIIGLVWLKGELISNHPPLFATLLWIWRVLGLGPTEATARLLPVLLGVGGVGAMYLVASRLFDRTTGLIAAFILAISPFHLHHSQELKDYVLVPFTCMLAAYFLYDATETNRRRSWVGYAITAALACYSDYFAGPFLVAVNVWFLCWLPGRLDRLWPWLIANVCGALLFVPHLLVMLYKVQTIMVDIDGFWVPEATPMAVIFFLKTVAFGYSDLKPYFYVATVLLILLGVCGMILACRKSLRAGSLVVFWLVIPIGLVYGVSLVGNSIFLIRALIAYGMAAYILVAVCVRYAQPAWLRAPLLLLPAFLMAASLNELYHDRYPAEEYPHRPGIKPAIEYSEPALHVAENWRDGDIVVHASCASWFTFYWYGLRGYPQFTGGVGSGYLHYIHATNPENNSIPDFRTYLPEEIQELVEGHNRVWFVYSEWARWLLEGNALKQWRWMDAHYVETDHQVYKDVELFLFAKRDNGLPISVVERDHDTGVEARLTYRTDREFGYDKLRPDSGLIATTPEERRGRLLLCFDEADEGGEVIQVGSGGNERHVYFSCENRTGHDVRCQIEAVPSDLLVEFASFYEVNPKSDTWSVNWRHNRKQPGYPNKLAVMTGAPRDGMERIYAAVHAPEGAYLPKISLLGRPGYADWGRAPLTLLLNGNSYLQELPSGIWPSYQTWWWLALPGPVACAPGQDIRIEVQTEPNQNGDGWAELAYLALDRVGGAEAPRPSVSIPGPGDVMIPAHSTRRWTVVMDEASARLDVWAFEQGAAATAYHIFKIWHDHTTGQKPGSEGIAALRE